MNETWNDSFLFTVDRKHAIYVTSVIFHCMVRLETPIDAQRNITVLTVVYSLSSFVMFAAENTLFWVDTSLLLELFFTERSLPPAS